MTRGKDMPNWQFGSGCPGLSVESQSCGISPLSQLHDSPILDSEILHARDDGNHSCIYINVMYAQVGELKGGQIETGSSS